MSLLIALKYWKEIALAVLLIAVVAMVRDDQRKLVERGKAIERARVADSTLAADSVTLLELAHRAAHVDTIYARDTVTLTKALKVTAIWHDTVERHITDTVLVKQYIAATDDALKSCTDVKNDCATKAAIAAARIAGLETDKRLLEVKLAAQPTAAPRSCAGSSLLWGVLGAGSGFGLRVALKPR